MPLFILTETSAGYGLLKATDKKLLDSDDLQSRLSTIDKIVQEVKFKQFAKFDSAAAALEEISGITEGKVTPRLAELLDAFKDEKKVSLAVAEKNLGNSILKLPNVNIKPITDSSTTELFRAIRAHLPELLGDVSSQTLQEMSLGLSHSLSRHKLKFSADKVDVMIVQAINLLDDLDKQLNTYAMRTKEWYGWHFPELAKILSDNVAYARVILAMGLRGNAKDADLSDILPEEIETAVKAAADISMGTEITEEDLENIRLLSEQVVRYSEYRTELAEYLENRMKVIAPNMNELIGYLVGARLIAHAGSVMSLAKSPGSTIQILGAEKALFRALKTKHNTPKYGIIYNSSLVGQASGKNKGKIARQLAAKVALGVRTDALARYGEDADEEERSAFGIQSRSRIENNLRRLEGKPLLAKGVLLGPDGQALAAPSKWNIKEARKYNADADGLNGTEAADEDIPDEPKKSKKPLIQEVEMEEANGDEAAEADDDVEMDDAAVKAAEKRRRKAEKEKRRAARAGDPSAAVVTSKPKVPSQEDLEKAAEASGLKLSKFMRKYERGQISINADGTINVLSKKELKAQEASNGVKRKYEEDEEEEEEEVAPSKPAKAEKPKKKKKKHAKEVEA